MSLQNLNSGETQGQNRPPQNFDQMSNMGDRPSMFNNEEFVPRERLYTQQRQEM